MTTKIIITDEDGPADKRAIVTITLTEDCDGGMGVKCASEPGFPGPAADPSHKQTRAQMFALHFIDSLIKESD